MFKFDAGTAIVASRTFFAHHMFYEFNGEFSLSYAFLPGEKKCVGQTFFRKKRPEQLFLPGVADDAIESHNC
jgi:hypothetical protein